MKILIDLDSLIKRCGYFATTKYRDGSWKNNGYGCTHRGNKSEPGKCYSFCCPVAVEVDYEEMLEIDPELAVEYEVEQKEHGYIESEWMVVWKPMYLKRYFKEVT
jgi:hypothetical protein